MLFIPVFVLAFAGAEDPVLTGALYCLGEVANPSGFTRDAPDKPTWRTAGPDPVLLSKTERGCFALRFRATTRAPEGPMDAWLKNHPAFRLDKDEISGGQRLREYSRPMGAGQQRLRLAEPANLDGPMLADPPSGVAIWSEPTPR